MPESQELTRTSDGAKPILSANRRLTTLTVDEMLMVAEGFFRSQVFKNGREPASKAEIFVIIMAGQELGIGPAAAMAGIRFIEGRPELSANLQLGAMKASGKYDYRAEFGTMPLFDDEGNDVTKRYPTPNFCKFTVFNVADGTEVGTTTFTMYDADRAGLLKSSRNGAPSNYLKYPPNMLFARAGSNASAFFTPDALMMRTYHTGEIEGETDAPVPELLTVDSTPDGKSLYTGPESQSSIGPAGGVPGINQTSAGEEPPFELEAEEIAPGYDMIDGEPDYFNPETEPPPRVVTHPQAIAPQDVPEFARTEEEQQQVLDKWGDTADSTPEPTVTQTPSERLLSPGQRGLIFVRQKKAGLTEERLKEILNEITGTPHIDRVPMRLVDAVLARLNDEAKIAKG